MRVGINGNGDRKSARSRANVGLRSKVPPSAGRQALPIAEAVSANVRRASPQPAFRRVVGSGSSDVGGQRVQSRIRRFVEPSQTCADHTRTSDPSRAGSFDVPEMRIVSDDTAARGRAHTISNPQPARLPPPSFDRRNIAFVRRGPSPRRNALVDHAIVDCRSPRPSNAHSAAVGSIRTVTARDSHHHHVRLHRPRIIAPC